MVFVKNFFSTNTISVLSQQLLIHIPFTDSPVLRHPSHGFFVVDSLALVHLHVFFQSHLFPGFCQFFFLLGNALTLDHQHALALWFFHLIAGQCFLKRSLIRFLILFRQLPADGQAAVAHKVAGIGQVGAGTVRAPLGCFEKALEAYAKKLGIE